MNTNIEYKKGILFIKIGGSLIRSKTEVFESEVIPIILGLDVNNVLINLSDVELIDNIGINSIIKISNIVNKHDGKVVLCEMNEYIKGRLKHSDIYDYCFRSKNERTSEGVFNI